MLLYAGARFCSATNSTRAVSLSISSVGSRIETQLADSRLRILIVGAGIAGATLASLLRRRGEPPALIERASEAADAGYMLGIAPLGGRVLNGLGLADEYNRVSLPVSNYEMYSHSGQLLQRASLATLVEQFGSWRGIERGVLLSMLRRTAGRIEYEATIVSQTETGQAVEVTFHDSSHCTFDVVVAADGIHSSVRKSLLQPGEVEEFDTGWGGFVAWSASDDQDTETYRELWAPGWGIGLYPTPERIGIFFAGRHVAIKDRDANDVAAEMETELPTGVFLETLRERDRSAGGFYWQMHDFRAKVWWRGRTVLLGDAATAFLPTAGIVASAAMDSAAALADELSRADSDHLSYALELYEKRQRRRVERMQTNSRRLSRLMFVNGNATAWARNQLLRFYTTKMLVRDISKVMRGD